MVCPIAVASSETDPPESIGTGWLVGRRTVITAGHVSRWENDGRKAVKVVAIPGRDRSKAPFGRIESRVFHYHPNWVGRDSDPLGNDIAAIRLRQPIGDTISFLGVAALTDASLAGRVVNIPGYPTEVTGQAVKRCSELWWHANHVRSLQPDRIFYDVDTSGGRSGSPVIRWPGPTASQAAPLVTGVHTRGDDQGDSASAAVRMNPAMLALTGEWIDADDRA